MSVEYSLVFIGNEMVLPDTGDSVSHSCCLERCLHPHMKPTTKVMTLNMQQNSAKAANPTSQGITANIVTDGSSNAEKKKTRQNSMI